MYFKIIMAIYLLIGLNYSVLYISDIKENKKTVIFTFTYMTFMWLFYIISNELINFTYRRSGD